MRLFAVCAPGIEQFLFQELLELNLVSGINEQRSSSFSITEEDSGGIEFEGDLKALYLANLNLRTASRILVRVGDFFATSFAELRRKAENLPWDQYLTSESSISLRVTCHKSRLYHSDAVAERISASINNVLGLSPSRSTGEWDSVPSHQQLVVVRLANDHCYISLDSSGEHLHRRGYRLATAKAPLRETLAAALIIASGWDLQSPFLDPFCGSGTLPIEAALMAQRIPPGLHREFAFQKWRNFQPKTWTSVLSQVNPRLSNTPVILASDRDTGAIQISISNAERARVSNWIQFSNRAVSSIESPGTHGWLVTNPPYGVRVTSGHDLRNLYAQTGKILNRVCNGWHYSILTSQEALFRQTGLHLKESYPFVNGGLRVKLFCGLVSQKK